MSKYWRGGARPNAAELSAMTAAGARKVGFGTSPRQPRPKLPQGPPVKPPAGKRGRLPTVSEHFEQVAVIRWWQSYAELHKIDARLLFAIPNAGAGAQRGQAGKMRAEGVQAGVPDLFLALPIPGAFHGLFIEMKSLTGRISPEQHGYIELLLRQNYNVLMCYGANQAMRQIETYCERIIRASK